MSNPFFPGDDSSPDGPKTELEKLGSQVSTVVGSVGSLFLAPFIYLQIKSTIETWASFLYENDTMASLVSLSVLGAIGWLSYLAIRQLTWLLIMGVAAAVVYILPKGGAALPAVF